jgi:hypothetical protein
MYKIGAAIKIKYEKTKNALLIRRAFLNPQ